MKNLKPGLYWVKPLTYSYKKNLKSITCDGKSDKWQLVEVCKQNANLVVHHLGWDCSEPITSFVDYIEAKIKDPDGNCYLEW